MSLFYEKRNLENIGKLADHTKAAALQWHDFLVANNINVLVYETIRSIETQARYVKQGASETMKSYHIVGQALDFVPVDGAGKLHYEWYGNKDIQNAIAKAKQLGFLWGGEWKTLVDKPHLQFNYRGYGTDTFTKATATAPTTAPTPQPSKPTTAPATEGGDATVRAIQNKLNDRYGAGIKSDGYYGPKTKEALLKAFQKEIGVAADGSFGPKTKAAADTIRLNAKGNLVWIAQAMLYCLGFNPSGVDGAFGPNTAAAALRFQKARSLAQDSIIGKNTWEALFK